MRRRFFKFAFINLTQNKLYSNRLAQILDFN